MNKLKMVGLTVAVALVGTTVTVLASGYPANSNATKIGGTGCRMVLGNDGKSYPSYCSIDVYKFTDEGNTCYVAAGGSHGDVPALYCVGGKQ